MWCTDVLVSYDLVASLMSDAEQCLVEYNLLRSQAATLQRNDVGTSNWQSWHNAAIGGVGFLFEDPTLWNATIYGKSGFLFQLENAMMDDGMWHEISLGEKKITRTKAYISYSVSFFHYSSLIYFHLFCSIPRHRFIFCCCS